MKNFISINLQDLKTISLSLSLLKFMICNQFCVFDWWSEIEKSNVREIHTIEKIEPSGRNILKMNSVDTKMKFFIFFFNFYLIPHQGRVREI